MRLRWKHLLAGCYDTEAACVKQAAFRCADPCLCNWRTAAEDGS
jgi:hypothetical protein